LIPAGTFLMGSLDSDGDASPNEKPQHRVRITRPFYLGRYLVTQKEWEAVMGKNPSNFKGPKNPVENVSWDDCQVFLGKLNAKSGGRGGKFSLPTEAQWEYACRAGSTTKFYFGDDKGELWMYAAYDELYQLGTSPVGGARRSNAWRLYDMHGNLWEWCTDWYDGGYYRKSATDDPLGPSTGLLRVIRGGSWRGGSCRSADRKGAGPGRGDFSLGLRVSLVPADK
jgi:formylglycine-generating enzyme required for sulfatase activity